MNMTKVFFLLTIMPDNPGPPPPNKAIAILCASPDAPTNPRRCVCQLIRQSVLFITSARRKAVWFLSTPRPTQQSDHLTNHVPQRASPSVKDIWGMSQTDKDPGVPLEVKPHPLPVKRTSSPSTMSHPAFAPAYINAPPQQYPQYVSSPTYVATTYQTSSEHWQRPTQQYANMPTGQYYTTPLQMGSPETVNGAYVPQYGQWMPPSPIDGQGNPIEPLSPSIYHPSDPSMPHRVRAGEPGPTRTSRTTRRRSTQDVVSTVPQLDGESAELPESSSLAAGKRSKTSAAASSSTDTKSFACDLCTATFTRKGDCQRHRRSVHTHETPYDCQGCGENFSRSDVRGKHWKASPECESLHWKEVCRAMGRSSLVEQDK